MLARMRVPALHRNAQALSVMRRSTVRTEGTLYTGISITKTGVSPRSRVRFSTSATTGATTSPTAYIAILQERDEAKQDDDLRQKDDDRADAFEHAVGQQAGQRPGRQGGGSRRGQHVLARAEQSHQRAGPLEDGFKDDEHQGEKNDRAP